MFNKYKSNPILMYSLKQSNLYVWLYNKADTNSKREKYKNILKQSSYEIDSIENKYLDCGQPITFRDIVKFCIIDKINKESELQKLFPDIVKKNLDLLIYCSFLPENRKITVGRKLDENNFTKEEKLTFVNVLGNIEKAVDTSIPSNY